jgi:small subunit ribosomal protein S10e
MTAKKDPFAKKHHYLEIPNLQVLKLLQSLTSRGFTESKFSWQWYYWKLTDAGIAYLREYLHLSADVTPDTHKRVKSTAELIRGGRPEGERRGPARGGFREGYRSQKSAGGAPEGFRPEFGAEQGGERSFGRGGFRGAFRGRGSFRAGMGRGRPAPSEEAE